MPPISSEVGCAFRQFPGTLLREIAALAVLSSAAVAAAGPRENGEKRSSQHAPNIVLIVADDLGYSDLGCYGGEIHTPRLDRLSRRGLRFTQFYNAARCCPTRASLLTGVHPHRAGVGHMTYDAGEPGYRGRLDPDVTTIAEALRAAGYRTWMTGKWHVCHFGGPAADRAGWPLQRGFERFFGTLPGLGSFWDPVGLMQGNRAIEPEGDFYYTEAITRRAVRWIEQSDGRSAPFFLYVAYTAPHYPLHAREEFIRKYDGVYDPGWDVLRQRRFERLKRLGIAGPGWRLPHRDPASVPWNLDPHKQWQAHRMQVYAAMVEQMDHGVGRIVGALTKTHQLDNTLLVVTSQ